MNEETTININSEAVNKVETALTIMAEKLGVASDHFYPIIVKQQLIDGYIWIGTSIPLLCIACFLFITGYKEYKNKNDPFGWFFFSLIFYGIFGIVLAITLSRIINPEYYALMEVKSFIK